MIHSNSAMSCINNSGTICFSPSRFSNQHVFSLGNLSYMKRRVPVLPLSFCDSDSFAAMNGKSTSHCQVSSKYLRLTCQAKGEESDGNWSPDGTVVDEQTLEKNLQKAVEEENYAKAAKIRDSLRFLQEDSKASVLSTNARFYNCFRSGDLAGMQSLWAKRNNVCCVHPGVSGISGYDLVMGSWEFVCAEYEFPIEIDVKDVEVYVKGDIGYVTCIEVVKSKGTSNWGKQFATNVFEKINGQWFISIHHASYVDL